MAAQPGSEEAPRSRRSKANPAGHRNRLRSGIGRAGQGQPAPWGHAARHWPRPQALSPGHRSPKRSRTATDRRLRPAAAVPHRSCRLGLSPISSFTTSTSRRIRQSWLKCDEVCRRAALIVDLRQSFMARLLARLLLPLLGAGRVAFHDGKLSADQAWPLARVQELADAQETSRPAKALSPPFLPADGTRLIRHCERGALSLSSSLTSSCSTRAL